MPTRVVKQGDTLSKIAAEEGVNLSDISGYKSGNPDLIFPNEVLNINKGAAPADPATDIGTGGGFDLANLGNYGLTTDEDKALSEIIANERKGATRDINEDDIRSKNLALYQKEIDAIDQIYASLITDEKVAGEDRLGQGRAISNRQGLIGSLRGESQRQNIVAKNSAAVGALQAERAAKIGAILGTARKAAVDEIAAERAAKQQSAADYLSYLKVQDERINKNVTNAIGSLIAQGYSLEDLDQEQLDELAKNLRVSTDQLRTTFDSLLPEDAAGDAFTLGRYDIRYDADGNVIARGAGAGGSGGGGSDTGGGVNDTLDVLTFDEFKQTPEAKAILNEEIKRQTAETGTGGFTTATAESYLREIYNDQIAELERTTGKKANLSVGDDKGNLTTTNQRDLNQAGLTNANASTQSFFLNLPSKIRDEIQRGVAAGIIQPEDLTIEEMQKVLDEEGSSSSNSSSSDGGDPLDF